MSHRKNKSFAIEVQEACWNCGGEEFTNSNNSHHMKVQLICTGCYEPQGEDEFDEEESW